LCALSLIPAVIYIRDQRCPNELSYFASRMHVLYYLRSRHRELIEIMIFETLLAARKNQIITNKIEKSSIVCVCVCVCVCLGTNFHN